MKEKFKTCMALMYPTGVTNNQLADLARVFMMGWVESLASCGLPPGNNFLMEHEFLTDGGWEPDPSWKWW